MPRTYPQNPLARLINTRMAEVGISRVDLMKRLGYANSARGLRRFDEFLANLLDRCQVGEFSRCGYQLLPESEHLTERGVA